MSLNAVLVCHGCDTGPGANGQLERLTPSRRAEHVEAVVAQLPAEVLPRLGLGLGDEDSMGTATTLARSRELRQMPFVAQRFGG
jgi:hypothetical protein